MLMVGHTQLSIKALCSVQRWSSLAHEIPRVRICMKCVKHSTPKRTVLLYNTLEPQRTFYTVPFGYNPLKIPLNHFHKYYIHTIHIFKRTRRPQKVCAFMCYSANVLFERGGAMGTSPTLGFSKARLCSFNAQRGQIGNLWALLGEAL